MWVIPRLVGFSRPFPHDVLLEIMRMVFQVRKPQQVPFFFLISALGRAAGVRTTIGEGTCCFPAFPETGRHNTRGICTLYTINAIHMSTPFYYQASAIHCLKRFISFSGSDIPHISRCTFSPRHRPFPACLPTFYLSPSCREFNEGQPFVSFFATVVRFRFRWPEVVRGYLFHFLCAFAVSL